MAHWPYWSRSASESGSRAARIAACAPAMSYSARRHSAVQARRCRAPARPRAGRRRAAGRSSPGLSSHSPAPRSSRSPARRVEPDGRLALGPVEGQRDVRVADQRDAVAALRRRPGTARRSGRTARTPRSGRAGRRGRGRSLSASPDGERPSRNSRVSGRITSRVHLAASAAPRENSSSDSTLDDGEVVVAGQADRAVGLGQRDAGVGLRAVADEVAEAPQLLDLRPPPAAAITASNACRLPWMSDAIATRMPRVCSVRRSWRLPVALVTAVVVAEAAVLADASSRPRARAGAGRGASLLQRGADREGRGLPQRAAAGSTSPRRRSDSACWC